MKALLCKSYGPPSNLVVEEISNPTCGPKDVIIDVKACSVNFPDTLIIRGLYQFKPDFPFSPGSDMSGVISAIGEQVKHLSIGQEVVAVVTHGGFSEKIAVPAARCIPKPPNMTMVEASAFLYTYSTSYYALVNRGHIAAGQTVLILGASGGVGLAAVDIAKTLGATVIAAASTDEKLAVCKQYGADHLINYGEQSIKDQVRAITDEKGVDIILDPIGGDKANEAIRVMAWEGRYLVVGFAAGEISKLPLNLALLKSCQVVGVFLGGFLMKYPKQGAQMMGELLAYFHKGELKPHIQQIFSLEEAPKAIQMMMDRKAIGKLVVEVG